MGGVSFHAIYDCELYQEVAIREKCEVKLEKWIRRFRMKEFRMTGGEEELKVTYTTTVER